MSFEKSKKSFAYFYRERGNKKYNAMLKKICKKMRNDSTTYGSELEKIGNELFKERFVGVFPSDLLPSLKNGECCIFNVDKASESGSHWVALAKEGNHLYFYDSFGRSPKELVSHAKGALKFLYDKEDAEQKIEQTDCGQRCLAWLQLGYKYGFNTILSEI